MFIVYTKGKRNIRYGQPEDYGATLVLGMKPIEIVESYSQIGHIIHFSLVACTAK